MFRPLRRKHKAIPEAAAKALLREEKRGVLAVNGDEGYPYAIPVDYYYDEDAGRIFFHGAKAGHKVDALRRDDKVCFTVWGNERHEEGQWAPYVQSVVIFGRCHLISDPEETVKRVRQLARRYYPSEEAIEEEIAADIKAAQLYELTIEHLSGKEIQEQ